MEGIMSYRYDDPIDCMVSKDHLNDCDDDGFCNFCGFQDTEVEVSAALDGDVNHDFFGVVVGSKDNGNLISIRDQDDNVFDVNREAVAAAW
jgi:hypothetical protein